MEEKVGNFEKSLIFPMFPKVNRKLILSNKCMSNIYMDSVKSMVENFFKTNYIHSVKYKTVRKENSSEMLQHGPDYEHYTVFAVVTYFDKTNEKEENNLKHCLFILDCFSEKHEDSKTFLSDFNQIITNNYNELLQIIKDYKEIFIDKEF